MAYISINTCGQIDTASFHINATGSPIYAFPDTMRTCENDSLLFINPLPNFISTWQNTYAQDSIYLTFPNSQYLYFELNNSGTCIINDSTYIELSYPNATITDIGWAMESNLATAYQWLFNGTDISGANSQVHVPTNNGDYQVYIIDSLGCTDTSDIFTISTASLEEEYNAVSIYKINNQIVINNAPINAVFELYDISGKLLQKSTLTNGNINLPSPTETLIYIVKLFDSDGKEIYIKKL